MYTNCRQLPSGNYCGTPVTPTTHTTGAQGRAPTTGNPGISITTTHGQGHQQGTGQPGATATTGAAGPPTTPGQSSGNRIL